MQCSIRPGVAVKLLEMSTTGAYIVLEEELSIGDRYTLLLERDEESVSLEGAVVSVDSPGGEGEGGAARAYVTGIKFESAIRKGKSGILDAMMATMDSGAPERSRLDLTARVRSAEAGYDYGGDYRVEDISFGGMRILTSQYMALDSKLSMKIGVSNSSHPVEVMGRVASSEEVPGKTPTLYNIGIEFTDIRVWDILALKNFIYSVQEL